MLRLAPKPMPGALIRAAEHRDTEEEFKEDEGKEWNKAATSQIHLKLKEAGMDVSLSLWTQPSPPDIWTSDF